MSARPHRHGASTAPVGVAVLTVSDTRNIETDRSGDLAADLLDAGGHRVVARSIVPDEPRRVRDALHGWFADEAVEAVVINGGTGVSSRDRTYEAVVTLLERRLDGFGELFRMLSWEQVGSAAMLSRAVGGVARGRPLFALPGSPKAVELGVSKLIAPQLRHLVDELRR